MNLSAKLTLDGLVRALRWQGVQKADLHHTRDMMGGELEPAGPAAMRVVDQVRKDRRS